MNAGMSLEKILKPDCLNSVREHLVSSKEKGNLGIKMVPISQIGFSAWSPFDSCKTPKRIKVEEQGKKKKRHWRVISLNLYKILGRKE